MKKIVLCMACLFLTAFQQPTHAAWGPHDSTQIEEDALAPNTDATKNALRSARTLLYTAIEKLPRLIPGALTSQWLSYVAHAEFGTITEPTITEGFLETKNLVRVPLVVPNQMVGNFPASYVVGDVSMYPSKYPGEIFCTPRFELYLQLPATQTTKAAYIRVDLLYSRATVWRLVDTDTWEAQNRTETAKILSLIGLRQKTVPKKR